LSYDSQPIIQDSNLINSLRENVVSPSHAQLLTAAMFAPFGEGKHLTSTSTSTHEVHEQHDDHHHKAEYMAITT